jgi:hypothetical protein
MDRATISSVQPRRSEQDISNSDLGKFFRNQDEQASSTSNPFNAGGTTVRLARPSFFYEDFKYTVFTFKGDYTNQIDPHHRIQVGGQARMHSLDMYRDASFLGAVDAKKQYYTEKWTPKPTGSAGTSDRMEYRACVNLSARRHLDPDAQEFTNYFAPTDQKTDHAPECRSDADRVTSTRKDMPCRRARRVTDLGRCGDNFSRIPAAVFPVYANYNNFGNFAPERASVEQIRTSRTTTSWAQWEFYPKIGLNSSFTCVTSKLRLLQLHRRPAQRTLRHHLRPWPPPGTRIPAASRSRWMSSGRISSTAS